jgi:hypothetical protein
MAAKNIGRQRRKLQAVIGIVGGAFLSAAFSSSYEVVTMHQVPPFPSIVRTFALFAVGVVMIAYQIVHE